MNRVLAALACVIVFAAALVGQPASATRKVTIRLLDAETRQPISGLVRIADETGTIIRPPELLSRGLGLPLEERIHEWSVMPQGVVDVTLPIGKLAISGIAGLETERVEAVLDPAATGLILPVKRFANLRAQNLVSANTHLHLMKLSREQSDRYLQEIPRADGLDLLFVSYLERTDADHDYITNRYTKDDLARLSQNNVLLANGEEHRHNFGAGGEGYGHVMLLDLKELVLPVSIGPGIMKRDTDGIPIQRGINQARRNNATAVWCHNDWGLERIPNWITGRLDAQNIFDGGAHGSYQHSFYACLNAGLRVPFSTGTDWFIYDFSRVYVPLKGAVTAQAWLSALKAGRSFITNGPLLEFTAGDANIGDRINLDRPGVIPVTAKATGRIDFRRLELVHNGKVIRTVNSQRTGNHFAAKLDTTLPIEEPGWLALRTPPPPLKGDPELSEPVELNEFGLPLFSHTSPIYIAVAGKEIFNAALAQELFMTIERNREIIAREGKFGDDEERERVLAVHTEAIETIGQWMAGK